MAMTVELLLFSQLTVDLKVDMKKKIFTLNYTHLHNAYPFGLLQCCGTNFARSEGCRSKSATKEKG